MTTIVRTARRLKARRAKAVACSTAILTVLAAPAALAQSAYTPEKGELETTVTTVYQDYDTAWQGKVFNYYPRTTTIQEYRVAIAFGITEDLSLDANTGYGTLTGGLSRDSRPNPNGCWNQPLNTLAGRQCQDPIPQGSRDGRLDSYVGLRWRAFREHSERWDSLPTIAIYGGAIIKGDYEPTPQALGNGANGVKGGVAFGRYWSDITFGLTANAEYQYLDGPSGVVPNNWNGNVGAYKFFGSHLFATAGYSYFRSLDGWDTGRGPFPNNPQNLPANLVGGPDSRDYNRMLNAVGRKEIWESYQLGGGYVTDGGTVVYASYSDVVDGRNTADRSTYSLNVTVPAQIFGHD
jgi:hypothetical protein